MDYEGFAYRQTTDENAPWIINFIAPAEDVLTWAGIPRRTTDIRIGFQRADIEERVQRARDFFKMQPNQSPTAIIIGLHPSDLVDVQMQGSPSDNIRKCTITIKDDIHTLSDEDVVVRLKKSIETRLTREAGHADNEDDETSSVIDAESAGEETDNEEIPLDGTLDEEDEEDEEIEIGRSLLKQLVGQLDNKEWVHAHMKDLREMVKPATIIDGQHRILGAARCEKRIPFTFCALYECSWPEQVFQFTVVNYTAKSIPDQYITANAALSLSKMELHTLQDRLRQAGVKIVEYDLMKVVNFDQESPFYELVNLTERVNPEKIGYKTMVRISREWWRGTRDDVKPILDALYPDVTGKGAKAIRLARWQKQEHWGVFFHAFWRAVKDQYVSHSSHEPGFNLWDVGHSNLMIAIVLYELQVIFFDDLGRADEMLTISEDGDRVQILAARVYARARKFLQWIPPEFFSTPWGTKSLNTSAGRERLQSALDLMVKKRGKYQFTKHALIKGGPSASESA